MFGKKSAKNDANGDLQDIGLRIASICGRYFLKSEHLHYGYWPSEMAVELQNLPKAQQLYAEFLKARIPASVKSILDVGCGTGHNASLLLDYGFAVDCVSPSDALSCATRDSLAGRGRLFQSTFEALDIDRKYDCILFSESFQYIDLKSAFENMSKFLNPGGMVLIADFFRIPADGTSPLSGGHRLNKFKEALAGSEFVAVSEEDITDFTAPNLQLVDEALQQVALPSRDLILDTLQRRYPWSYAFMRFWARLLFNQKLLKMEYKYFSGERNADNFKKFKRYLVYVLKRKSEASSVVQ